MEVLSGFPFFSVEFNRDGAAVDRVEADALLTYLSAQRQAGTPVTDLIILSHGWNNDLNDARLLYTRVLAAARGVLDSGASPGLAGRTLAVMGVFWPSKRYADGQLIPGGAAAFGENDTAEQSELGAQIDALSGAIATPAASLLLAQAKTLLPNLNDRASARRQFADLLRAALQRDPGGSGNSGEDADAAFFTLDGEELFQKLQTPPGASPDPASTDSGGAAGIIEGGANINPDASGSAAGFGDLFGNMFGTIGAATKNLLNVSTYFEMKARSGIVGRTGVYSTLREVAGVAPELRMHVIGHSFGGRLVTSVALGPQGGAPLPLSSMTLLQAAYSHNGLGVNFDGLGHNGGFRDVIAQSRVRGPIVISFTINDKAVGTAYPLASRISQDNADALGDAQDIFGGMGRNGAQHTPEAAFLTMQPVGGSYSFHEGGVYNLNSDAVIQAHTDIAHPEVAHAFFSAIAAGGSFPVQPATGVPGASGGTAAGPAGPRGGDATGTAEAGGGPGAQPDAAPPPVRTVDQGGSGGAAGFDADATASAAGWPPPAGSVGAGPLAAEPGRGAPSLQERIERNLDSSVIANSLRARIDALLPGRPVNASPKSDETVLDVIIDVNQNYAGALSPSPLTAGNALASGLQLPVSSRERAKNRVRQLLQEILGGKQGQGIYERKSHLTHQYLFACLSVSSIFELVRRDNEAQATRGSDAKINPPGSGSATGPNVPAARKAPPHRSIYRIWEDSEVNPLLTQSVGTIKANAAQVAFGALGKDIVWAVMDSGIDVGHRHFDRHANLKNLPAPLRHTDFSRLNDPPNPSPQTLPAFGDNDEEESNAAQALTDAFGHGTHVAGIIAGSLGGQATEAGAVGSTSATAQGAPATPSSDPIIAVARQHSDSGDVDFLPIAIDSITGIAPQCKLLSLKVLDDAGRGQASSIIAAINYIQEVNGNGRRIVIHGVNLSVGYGFDPEWFACGRSPLCVEVDRLVRSGVVVVVAAGNTGYGFTNTQDRGVVTAGLVLSINDPGNAELAITVGSTHKEMPHVYGVSYFSSKGPTGDGRLKPDLVAPGEKVLSCAAGRIKARVLASLQSGAHMSEADDAGVPAAPLPEATGVDFKTPIPGVVGSDSAPSTAATGAEAAPRCDYVEQSGTSMAAPHVSGAIAAFLSVRREYIGQPEQVKQIFTETATDLGRQRDFQGHGLLDLMRAMQSV